jgi:hypothetical protein
MFARTIAAILLSAASLATHAESLTYELYELSGGGKRTLLVQGVRQYSIRDVLVEERGSATDRFWSKEIPVANGFSAGVSIFPEPDLTGFGLWLKDRQSFWGKVSLGGFSWDWFDREAGNVYRKLQGSGRVRVTLGPSPRTQEIVSVEVLEDITLRAKVKPWFLSFFSDADTHNLVVKKGSVLRFAP